MITRIDEVSQSDPALSEPERAELAACRTLVLPGTRTYIPEPESGYERRWTDKPQES